MKGYTTLFIIQISLICFACSPERQKKDESSSIKEDSTEIANLVANNCQTCHTLPNPKSLPKEVWRNNVLPEMALFFGLFYENNNHYVPIPDYVYDELAYMKNVPQKPRLTVKEYESIVHYFQTLAPEHLNRPSIKPLPEQSLFTTELIHNEVPISGVTLVKILKNGMLAVANASDSSFIVRDGKTILKKIVLPNYPIHLEALAGKYWITRMGSFFPLDDSLGSLIVLDKNLKNEKVVLRNLIRPVHAAYADLNGDNNIDIIVSEFGSNIGRLTWYEYIKPDRYKRHVLSSLPGAIKTIVRDIDKDGYLDIIALMGQGAEGIYFYRNLANGLFERKTLLHFPPTFGSTDFDLIDIDGDNREDIVYVNGDNADYPQNPPILRPYQGLRIYLNTGNTNFDEVFFYPVNGPYKVMAKDFNRDGLIDFATISHFADYYDNPKEGFLLFQNKGNLKFNVSSSAVAQGARWMVMDMGDIDKDGDFDLILGSALSGVETAPMSISNQWIKNRVSIGLFSNTTIVNH